MLQPLVLPIQLITMILKQSLCREWHRDCFVVRHNKNYYDTERSQEFLKQKCLLVADHMENKLGIDIVLLTIYQPVEGREAMEQYNLRSEDWEQNMQDIADDFWDNNRFGYNKGIEGDGILLLHNWYPNQQGEYISTSGKVMRALSSYDLDTLLEIADNCFIDAYGAYKAYIDEIGYLLD